jgi:hypothetical protein
MPMSETKLEAVPANKSETGRDELYVIRDGKRIAKRGYPGSKQAGTWVSLEPGYTVVGSPDSLVIEYEGLRVQ